MTCAVRLRGQVAVRIIGTGGDVWCTVWRTMLRGHRIDDAIERVIGITHDDRAGRFARQVAITVIGVIYRSSAEHLNQFIFNWHRPIHTRL